jgi:hypothetical protein
MGETGLNTEDTKDIRPEGTRHKEYEDKEGNGECGIRSEGRLLPSVSFVLFEFFVSFVLERRSHEPFGQDDA